MMAQGLILTFYADFYASLKTYVLVTNNYLIRKFVTKSEPSKKFIQREKRRREENKISKDGMEKSETNLSNLKNSDYSF